MKKRTVAVRHPLDLAATLAPLKHGPADPTIRLGGKHARLALRTPMGGTTLAIELIASEAKAEAWGPGADWILQRLPRILGLLDRPDRLVPRHPLVRDVMRRAVGSRMGASGLVMDVLIPTILGQRVTSIEAHRSYRSIVLRFGEPAPGPLGLHLPPDPVALAQIPYYELHRHGVERSRAVIVRKACEKPRRLQEAAEMPPREAERRLRAIPGIGPWTSACVVQAVHGDPDAVIVGDYHLPNIVSWALAHEPRATDQRMLELLQPYRGQRARVVRLLKRSGVRPPKFGPRHRIRDLAAS